MTSYVPVSTQQSRNDLATAKTLTAPAGANALFMQATVQDVYVNLDGTAGTSSSLELSTLDGMRLVEVGFLGTLSVLEKVATAVLKYQWVRVGRRQRDR